MKWAWIVLTSQLWVMPLTYGLSGSAWSCALVAICLTFARVLPFSGLAMKEFKSIEAFPASLILCLFVLIVALEAALMNYVFYFALGFAGVAYNLYMELSQIPKYMTLDEEKS